MVDLFDQARLCARINKLATLRSNWDTCGGTATSKKIVSLTLEAARTLVKKCHIIPQPVPVTSRVIQLEWYTAKGEVELTIFEDAHVEGFQPIYMDNSPNWIPSEWLESVFDLKVTINKLKSL